MSVQSRGEWFLNQDGSMSQTLYLDSGAELVWTIPPPPDWSVLLEEKKSDDDTV